MAKNGYDHVGVFAVGVVTLDAGAYFAAPEICDLGVIVALVAPRTAHDVLKAPCGFVVPLEIAGHLVTLFLL